MSRPPSPAPAELTGPVTGKHYRPPASPVSLDLVAAGYVEEELFAAGEATAYRPAGALGADGCWDVEADDRAPYRTRVVVRRPAEAARFSGTLLVEWCNVSGGVEAAPDWSYLHEEIVRAGHAYAAVSTQALGVVGGTGLLAVRGVQPGSGLAAVAPDRYGALAHPGDRYAFDLFSQVGLALRHAGARGQLGGLAPAQVLALGESQSAFFLTTYVDAVHPVAGAYDGYLVHSRGGNGASLGGTVLEAAETPRGLRIRHDLDVPVLVFETETDLGPRLDFAPARQPDSERVRTWEVAGTAHADAYLIGPFVEHMGWTEPVNDGPQHFVVQAALDALVRWARDGAPAPSAEPLALTSTDPPVIARDDDGNALGGVRTPDVDVAVAALSGDAPRGADEMRSLFGSTVPFGGTELLRRYGSRHGYRDVYEASLDATIAAGFMLAADRPSILARARRVEFPG